MTDPVFHSLLNHTFAVSRIRRTPNGQGGWAVDYVANGEVLGRLRPASGAEVLAAQQEGWSLSHVLYVEGGEDIQRGDMVVGGGQTVYVAGVRDPSTAHEHLEIDCTSTQPEVSAGEGS